MLLKLYLDTQLSQVSIRQVKTIKAIGEEKNRVSDVSFKEYFIDICKWYCIY
ncbi:MAG: hypothetical protein ACM3X7_07245 [Solirubrobacterales bacterium]